MRVFYNERFNIDLGILGRLHPFDGTKFRRVWKGLTGQSGITIVDVVEPIPHAVIESFATPLLRRLLTKKRYILEALEVPYLPLVPFSFVDRLVLEPMRWGVGATLQAARQSLAGGHCWNLAGGYHHASRANAEGFCIYNDVGITVQELRRSGALAEADQILIIDIDAHHGNGNARIFQDDARVSILDIYDADIYPNSPVTKARVDVSLPLRRGTSGATYLEQLRGGLKRLEPRYRMAFVVAGTDVLKSDPLGGLALSTDDCVERDGLVLDRLDELGIPSVVLGGGGYGPESASAILRSILNNTRR